MTKNWLNEITLSGQHITLKPLKKSYQGDLVIAAGELSTLWYTSVPSNDTIAAYMDEAMQSATRGEALPFVVQDNKTGKIIGSTRFCHAVSEHRRVEIGYTWYNKSYQRSAVNTECKLLMLSHAFDILNAIAVEFRTHWHNHASRAAIARLGAKQDGVIRNDKIHPDGEYRDTVVFSIIESEWSVVKKSLIYKLLK